MSSNCFLISLWNSLHRIEKKKAVTWKTILHCWTETFDKKHPVRKETWLMGDLRVHHQQPPNAPEAEHRCEDKLGLWQVHQMGLMQWCHPPSPLWHCFPVVIIITTTIIGSQDPSSVHFQISTMSYPSSEFFFSFLGSLMHTHTHNLLQRNCNRKTHNLLTLIHTFRYPEKSTFLWVGHWFCNASKITPTQFNEAVWEGH